MVNPYVLLHPSQLSANESQTHLSYSLSQTYVKLPHAPCLLNSPIIGALSIYTIFSNVPLIYKRIEFFFFRKDGEIS